MIKSKSLVLKRYHKGNSFYVYDFYMSIVKDCLKTDLTTQMNEALV